MGRILIFLVLALGLLGCRQKSHLKNQIMETSPKLTSKNYLETMVKAVKHYPKEPYYYLFVNHQACYFEILVNDLPVYKYFKDGQMVTPIDIYFAINKSGKQKITYKLYPQTEREEGEGFKTLLDWTSIKIEVFQRNKADTTGNAFASEKEVLKHTNLMKTDQKTFIAAGKDYYEYTFTFDATVPYQNAGWEHSEDLSKMDEKKLLEKTENAYRQVWQLLKDKKEDEYFSLLSKKELETSQAEYSSKTDLEETLSAYLESFTDPSYEMQPLKGYKLTLYGGGKLACLEQTSLDQRLRGELALWAKSKDEDGNIIGNYDRLYFHIPKGKTNFEIIR